MTLTPELREAVLLTIPRLRAFAISLTGNSDRADDLVQDTLLRGLSNLDRFQPGTSIQAWLFTILRNLFYSAHRKRRREVEDLDGGLADKLSSPPEQPGHLDMQDLREALKQLPPEQLEALLLVTVQGFSYEAAAQICGVRVGTIKSRINRARARLSELMGVEESDDLGSDRLTKAVVQDRARL